jgi:transmembrane sensor
VKIIDIHRYLSGEASQEEMRELEQWLEVSRENRKTYESFRDIYNVEIDYKYSYDTEAALSQFRKVMDQSPELGKNSATHKTHHRRKSKSAIWYKVAAIFIAVAGISIYMVTSSQFAADKQGQEILSGTTIETAPGEQKSFRLSDGSRIKLNAASEIFIPENYGVESRDVKLIGEAFFEIASGHHYQFNIETEAARISVLGTSFSVRAWNERDESVIAVQTGRVSVHSSDLEIEESTILNAGEYTQVLKGLAPGPAIEANLDQYTGWTNQMFVFDETPLKDMLQQLELFYNVEIKVQDSVSIDDPVTARYSNESLEEILKYTSITHGVQFEVKSLNNNNNNQ